MIFEYLVSFDVSIFNKELTKRQEKLHEVIRNKITFVNQSTIRTCSHFINVNLIIKLFINKFKLNLKNYN